MATALYIASRLHLTPLLDIEHPSFAKFYEDGVYRSLFKERWSSPLTDHYMLENLRASLTVRFAPSAEFRPGRRPYVPSR